MTFAAVDSKYQTLKTVNFLVVLGSKRSFYEADTS